MLNLSTLVLKYAGTYDAVVVSYDVLPGPFPPIQNVVLHMESPKAAERFMAANEIDD